MPKRDPERTIWRVAQITSSKGGYTQLIYSGIGTPGRLAAERKYATVTRKRGRIGLYRGIFPVKMRPANQLPKNKK